MYSSTGTINSSSVLSISCKTLFFFICMSSLSSFRAFSLKLTFIIGIDLLRSLFGWNDMFFSCSNLTIDCLLSSLTMFLIHFLWILNLKDTNLELILSNSFYKSSSFSAVSFFYFYSLQSSISFNSFNYYYLAFWTSDIYSY